MLTVEGDRAGGFSRYINIFLCIWVKNVYKVVLMM